MDESEDEEIYGHSAPSRRPSRVVSKRGRLAKAEPEDEGEELDVCWLCDEPLLAGQGHAVKKWRQHDAHPACYNAIRCHHRITNVTPAAKEKDERLLRRDPLAWKGKVLPLVKDDGVSRTAARNEAKRRQEEEIGEEDYEKHEQESGVEWLTKDRYIAFMGFWHRMPSPDASEDFEEKFEGASTGHEDSDGSRIVKVKGNRRDSRKKGRKEYHKSFGKKTIGHGDDRPRGRSRRRGRHDDRGEGRERGSRADRGSDGSAGARAASPPQIGRGSTGASSSSQRPPAAACSVPQRRRAGKQAASHRPLGKPRGTAPGSERTSSPPKSRSRSQPPRPQDGGRGTVKTEQESEDEQARKEDTPKGKLSMVEFMKRKAALKAELDEAVAKATGKKSVRAKLQEESNTLGAYVVQKIEPLPETALADHLRAVSGCRALFDKLESCRPAGLSDIIDSVSRCKDELEEQEEQLIECYDAVHYLYGLGNKESARSKGHSRYQRTKLMTKLVQNGWGKNAAKHFAKHLQDGDLMLAEGQVDAGGFDHLQPTLWHASLAESLFGASVVKGCAEFLKCSEFGQESKIEVLDRSLKRNPAWMGAVARLGSSSGKLDFLKSDADMLYMDSSGGCPWLCSLRHFGWRHGPQSIPLPGVGMLMQVLEGSVALTVGPISGLLKLGIALSDLPAFLETDSGQTWLHGQCKVFEMVPSDVAWLPYGFIVLPVGCTIEDLSELKNVPQKEKGKEEVQAKDKEQEQEAQDVQTKKNAEKDVVARSVVACINIFVKSWAKELELAVWTAIDTSISKNLEQNTGQTLWKDRTTMWTEFAKLMADS